MMRVVLICVFFSTGALYAEEVPAPPVGFEGPAVSSEMPKPAAKSNKITRDTQVKTPAVAQKPIEIDIVRPRGFRVAALDGDRNNPFKIREGDVLLEADGKKMNTFPSAQNFFANAKAFQKIKILRKGKVVTLTKEENRGIK